MSAEKRVLFLSAHVGAGHMSAAEAVSGALAACDANVRAKVVDSYAVAGKFLGKMAAKGYIQLVKFLPQVYSFFYELRERDSAISSAKSKLTQIFSTNFRKLVEDYRPHILVCTHAFPSGAAAALKEEYGIPLVSIVTDFTVHPFWIHANTDLYLVGNDQIAEDLEEQGISRKHIKVTGIPVDPRFRSNGAKFKIREDLSLDPEANTLLLMGGGAGLGPLGWTLRSLRRAKHPVQVLVVTGMNRGLQKRLEKYAVKLNRGRGKKNAVKKVKVFGFVDNIHDLMNASDLLITKPGGLTSSEALAAELPIIIVKPLPGQEIRNAQYLVKERAAVLVKKLKNLTPTVDALLDDPQRMAKIKERARLLRKPDAAYEAARSILNLL